MNKPNPDAVAQAALDAGTVHGARQGIAQCAENLRKQAAAWRREAEEQVSAAARLDEIAEQFEAEAHRREADEVAHRGALETLLAAARNADRCA